MLKKFMSYISNGASSSSSPSELKRKEKVQRSRTPLVKNICSSIFSSQQTNSSSCPLTQKLQCPLHPGQNVHTFCLKDNCASPTICSLCKPTHPKDHSKSFIPVQNLYKDDFANPCGKTLASKFSEDYIEGIRQEVMGILGKMEEDILKSIKELKTNADMFFTDLHQNTQRLQKASSEFAKQKNPPTINQLEIDQLKKLIENYKILKQDLSIFDINLDVIPENLQKEVEMTTSRFKFEIVSKINAAMDLKPIDFSKLKVRASYSIPKSEGVLYEACAFIPKWKLLAVGYRKNQQGSLGIFDLTSQEVVSSIDNIHKRWINHVIWVDKWNFLVTCSNDLKIRVFAVSEEGKKIRPIKVFPGHTKLVRCIKYIEEENILVSAGDDPDIKLWDLKNMKRLATISTEENTNMDGSIAYIPQDQLIGVGFRSGVIRFYHLFNRTKVMEFKTGFENFYTYALQYLPKRKMIIGRVKEHVIKVWKYDEEKKRVENHKVINTKGSYPDCIIANEDETQLLFTSRDQFLETYDFGTDKISQCNLSSHIKKSNGLVYLNTLGKVSVCDYTSGKFSILH